MILWSGDVAQACRQTQSSLRLPPPLGICQVFSTLKQIRWVVLSSQQTSIFVVRLQLLATQFPARSEHSERDSGWLLSCVCPVRSARRLELGVVPEKRSWCSVFYVHVEKRKWNTWFGRWYDFPLSLFGDNLILPPTHQITSIISPEFLVPK